MEGVFGTENKKNPHATEHMLRTAHWSTVYTFHTLSIETDKTIKLYNARKFK